MFCKTCHYPLKQLSEPRCPECGREFDPSDAGTFDASQPIWKKARPRLLIIGCCIYPIVFLLILYPKLANDFRGRLQGKSITFSRASLSDTILHSAADGLVIWPFVFLLVSVVYVRVLRARLNARRLTSQRPNLNSRYWLCLLIAGGAISLCMFWWLYSTVVSQPPPSVYVNQLPMVKVTIDPMPMSSRLLQMAVLALVLWPLVVVVLVLCSLPFGYTHQVKILCDRLFRLPDG